MQYSSTWRTKESSANLPTA